MNKRSRDIDEEVKNRYLDKLKEYKKKGVKVVIDGYELPENEWHCIFNYNEDADDQSKMFYMADFIAEPDGGHISEVRFDKICIKDFTLR